MGLIRGIETRIVYFLMGTVFGFLFTAVAMEMHKRDTEDHVEKPRETVKPAEKPYARNTMDLIVKEFSPTGAILFSHKLQFL